MLSDSDILETEIDEKYIFQQKTKKNFLRGHWYVTSITSLRGQVTHESLASLQASRYVNYSIFAFLKIFII